MNVRNASFLVAVIQAEGWSHLCESVHLEPKVEVCIAMIDGFSPFASGVSPFSSDFEHDDKVLPMVDASMK